MKSYNDLEAGDGKYHDKIHTLVELHSAGKLTKSIVKRIFASMPSQEQEDAIGDLEQAISEAYENLPE